MFTAVEPPFLLSAAQVSANPTSSEESPNNAAKEVSIKSVSPYDDHITSQAFSLSVENSTTSLSPPHTILAVPSRRSNDITDAYDGIDMSLPRCQAENPTSIESIDAPESQPLSWRTSPRLAPRATRSSANSLRKPSLLDEYSSPSVFAVGSSMSSPHHPQRGSDTFSLGEVEAAVISLLDSEDEKQDENTTSRRNFVKQKKQNSTSLEIPKKVGKPKTLGIRGIENNASAENSSKSRRKVGRPKKSDVLQELDLREKNTACMPDANFPPSPGTASSALEKRTTSLAESDESLANRSPSATTDSPDFTANANVHLDGLVLSEKRVERNADRDRNVDETMDKRDPFFDSPVRRTRSWTQALEQSQSIRDEEQRTLETDTANKKDAKSQKGRKEQKERKEQNQREKTKSKAKLNGKKKNEKKSTKGTFVRDSSPETTPESSPSTTPGSSRPQSPPVLRKRPPKSIPTKSSLSTVSKKAYSATLAFLSIKLKKEHLNDLKDAASKPKPKPPLKPKGRNNTVTGNDLFPSGIWNNLEPGDSSLGGVFEARPVRLVRIRPTSQWDIDRERERQEKRGEVEIDVEYRSIRFDDDMNDFECNTSHLDEWNQFHRRDQLDQLDANEYSSNVPTNGLNAQEDIVLSTEQVQRLGQGQPNESLELHVAKTNQMELDFNGDNSSNQDSRVGLQIDTVSDCQIGLSLNGNSNTSEIGKGVTRLTA